MTLMNAEKILADNDAHLENKRKYYAITVSNLVLYIVEIIVLIATQFGNGNQAKSIFMFK